MNVAYFREDLLNSSPSQDYLAWDIWSCIIIFDLCLSYFLTLLSKNYTEALRFWLLELWLASHGVF